MTTVNYTWAEVENPGEGKAWRITWPALLNGNDGLPVILPTFMDRSVQVEGTAGAGLHVLIEGSNDGTNYATLHDPATAALDFTAVNQIKEVLEATFKLRPRVSAGDGTTSVNVTLYARSTRR